MTDSTTATFQADVLDSDIPVLVDFWAPWCGPCRAVSPVLDAIAADHPELKVVKVNIDDEPDLAAAYSITSIPAMRVFVGGEIVKSITGAKPRPALEHDLAAFLTK